MWSLDEIKKISAHESYHVITLLSGTVFPGMLTLWYLCPGLLDKPGLLGFVLFSFAITVPILGFNTTMLVGRFSHPRWDLSYTLQFTMMMAATGNFFIFGGSLGITFLTSLDYKFFLKCLAAFEICAVIMLHSVAYELSKQWKLVAEREADKKVNGN